MCGPGSPEVYVPVPGSPTLAPEVKAAIIAVMDATPARFERNPDGAYLLTEAGERAKNEGPGVQAAFEWFATALTAELQRRGLCAGFFSDQLEVARPGEVAFEGYHVHNRGGGNVIFSPPKYEDTLAPQPVPCPAEAPGCAKFRIHVSAPGTFPRGRRVDVTPLAAGEPWCLSQGFLDPDGSGQGWCPYGQEGAGDAQRRACETREGPYVFKFNGAVVPQEENPLQVWLSPSSTGTIQVCARNGNCSEVSF